MLLQRLCCVFGRSCPELPADARRGAKDPHMWTHAAFLPGLALAWRADPPLAVCLVVITALSLLYHRNHERPGALAALEGLCAKAFFAYGAARIPGSAFAPAYAACLCLTAGTFCAVMRWPQAYDCIHPLGQHVVPGVWAALAAYESGCEYRSRRVVT
jgi:hypothetical protein